MKVSDGYLEKVDKFIFNGIPIERMNMTDEQKMRTLIAYEAYQMWMSDKQVRATDLCRRIAARIYADMLQRSHHDEKYADLCRKLNIREGVPRDYSRIANDVQTFDHIVGRFNNPTYHIEKAKVIDASDWLIEEGKKSKNDRSVANGAKLKMELFNGFDEHRQGYDQLANTDINITGDVSVVKPDRVNYTDEEKQRFAKKFGIPMKEVEELVAGSDGVYETAPVDADEEEDIFIREEQP